MDKQVSEKFLSLPNDQKILIIAGPTASGKTSLGVNLAKKYEGEIISADSRQIYIGMDIGTGKEIENCKLRIANSELREKIKKKINTEIQVGTYKLKEIPVWGLDLISPDEKFSVAQWVEFAKLVVADIHSRGKLPIIVGGTGFWIKALLKGIEWGRVPPNKKLRIENEKLSVKELQKKIKEYSKEFWKNLTPSDWQNPRRLIRRIEIAEFLQTHSEEEARLTALDEEIFKEKIYLNPPQEKLNQNISKRVKKRLDQGLIEEIKSLLEKGYSFADFGLNTFAYKEFKGYFEEEKTLEQAVEEWEKDEQDYARRQKVWFDKYFKGRELIFE